MVSELTLWLHSSLCLMCFTKLKRGFYMALSWHRQVFVLNSLNEDKAIIMSSDVPTILLIIWYNCRNARWLVMLTLFSCLGHNSKAHMKSLCPALCHVDGSIEVQLPDWSVIPSPESPLKWLNVSITSSCLLKYERLQIILLQSRCQPFLSLSTNQRKYSVHACCV